MSHAARSGAPETSGVLASITPARPGQTIISWLARLETLLGLPAPTSSEIVEELETHLRERVDDLVRSGTPEAQAVHLAISELGDIADLAVGYRRAHKTSPWRPIMKALLFVAVGSAITLGASALVPQGPAPDSPPSGVRVYAPGNGGWQAGTPAPDKPMSLTFDEMRLEEVLQAVAALQGAGLHIQRHAFDQAGLSMDDQVSLNVKNVSLARTLSMINESLDRLDADAIDVRFADGIMEVAPRQFFDRRESVLAAYDIANLVEQVNAEEVIELLTSVAEPESWIGNGGEFSQARLVAGKLFVVGPPRVQSRVTWVLEQLSEPQENDRQGSAAPREVRSIALSHALAAELSLAVMPLLDMRGVRVSTNEQTNSLIVQGSQAQLDSLELLISRFDVAPEVPLAPGR